MVLRCHSYTMRISCAVMRRISGAVMSLCPLKDQLGIDRVHFFPGSKYIATKQNTFIFIRTFKKMVERSCFCCRTPFVAENTKTKEPALDE